MARLKVWIDQDLCTGDALCAEMVPSVFRMSDDGLAYVQEHPVNFPELREAVVFEPGQNGGVGGAKGLARVPEALVEDVVEAAEDCPGECIFFETVDD